jgi:hypothetical protein
MAHADTSSIGPPSWWELLCVIWVTNEININPLNAELNHICHLLTLLSAHPIFHISRIRVKTAWWVQPAVFLQAMFAAFPWSAIIMGREGNYIGGAVLVGTYSVLTAAHKVASYV